MVAAGRQHGCIGGSMGVWLKSAECVSNRCGLSVFAGPHEVISAWLDSSHQFDGLFHSRPEMEDLQWVVTPPSGDAEIGLVWCNVMNSVVLTGQNYVPLL